MADDKVIALDSCTSTKNTMMTDLKPPAAYNRDVILENDVVADINRIGFN
jgi:hypothetical protein